MLEKIWKYYPDICELCCGDLDVYTDSETEEGWVCDGDLVRCKNCNCTGHAVVHDYDSVAIRMTSDKNWKEHGTN